MANPITGLTPKVLDFDPESLEKKYSQERKKRLRNDGNKQYLDTEGDPKLLNLDVDPKFRREPIDGDVGTLIVGGGFGGILAAVRLMEREYKDVFIIEKGSELGGTWYWNQYPGVRCDVESYIYLPLLEELGGPFPPEKYATGKYILKHVGDIDKKWGLSNKALFRTEVVSMTWDDERSQWILPVYCTTRNYLGIPGIASFKGHSFHTSRWDYDYTGGRGTGELTNLKDKRVAIIGTGATSVQAVPAVAQYAKHFYVFQRTPSAINVRNNYPTEPTFASSQKPGWQRVRMINFNSCINGEPVEEDLVNDGWTQDVLMAIPNEDGDFASYLEKLRLADFRKMEGIRARVDEVVKDKKTAEQLKPWYGSICKRPCFHDGYLNCFNQPNCILIDTDGKGPERISEKGIVINGQEYEVDLIIYSTGFWAPGSRPQPYGIVINGANGISLAEKWRDGTSTYLGIQSNGFPNWYNISLIQSGGSMNITFMLDTAAQHIAYVISECEKRGIRSIEPTVKAEEEWVNDIVEAAMMRRGFIANCTPSYYNHEGHLDDVSPKESPYFAGANAWYNILEEWRAHGNMEGMQKTLRTSRSPDHYNLPKL